MHSFRMVKEEKGKEKSHYLLSFSAHKKPYSFTEEYVCSYNIILLGLHITLTVLS